MTAARAGAGPARLEVLATGPSTTVQDLGRPGLAHLGVGRSGAADRVAHRLAQRLVGNAEDAAGLEVLLGGLRVRARGRTVVAVTGAPAPLRVVGLDGENRTVDGGTPVELADGAELVLGAATTGTRCYLAVRGGVDVAPVLGSRATDVLARLGPDPVAAGDVLAVGTPTGPLPGVDLAPPLRPDAPALLRVVPGPRDDWFAPGAVDDLCARTWTTSSASDRVGVRLEGEPLVRAREGELPSEGVVRGSLQVPPSGLPTLLLADHPVTGGYPVVAVVVDADTDHAAQLRPGDPVRFVRR